MASKRGGGKGSTGAAASKRGSSGGKRAVATTGKAVARKSARGSRAGQAPARRPTAGAARATKAAGRPRSTGAAARAVAAKRTAGRSGASGVAQPRVVLLLGTRKGAWLLHGDAARRRWRIDGPHFLGHIVSHVVLDPRDGRTLLAAAKTGHLGPTVFRSTDLGRTWKEATRPPAFAKVAEGTGAPPARSVDHTFCLTPGHASAPGV